MIEKEKKSRVRKPPLMPVSSFGPELLALLIKGGSTPIEVKCSSSAEATKLVQRLYALRKQMREERHRDAAKAQRAKISNQVKGHRSSTILISPYDYEYRDIIRAAGVEVDLLPSNIIEELQSEEEGTQKGGAQKGAFTDPIKPPSPNLPPETERSERLDSNLLANLLKDS